MEDRSYAEFLQSNPGALALYNMVMNDGEFAGDRRSVSGPPKTPKSPKSWRMSISNLKSPSANKTAVARSPKKSVSVTNVLGKSPSKNNTLTRANTSQKPLLPKTSGFEVYKPLNDLTNKTAQNTKTPAKQIGTGDQPKDPSNQETILEPNRRPTKGPSQNQTSSQKPVQSNLTQQSAKQLQGTESQEQDAKPKSRYGIVDITTPLVDKSDVVPKVVAVQPLPPQVNPVVPTTPQRTRPKPLPQPPSLTAASVPSNNVAMTNTTKFTNTTNTAVPITPVTNRNHGNSQRRDSTHTRSKSECSFTVSNNQPAVPRFIPTLEQHKDTFGIFRSAVNVATGLEIKEKTFKMRLWKYAFFGCKLVDWLVANGVAKTREDGVKISNEFVKFGLIEYPVTKGKEFDDSKEVFCLTLKGKVIRREQLEPYFALVFDTTKGVEIKDRYLQTKLYKSSFVGHELIDWFIKERVISEREQGLKIGRAFLESDLIEHVTQDHHFKDSLFLYQLTRRGVMRRMEPIPLANSKRTWKQSDFQSEMDQTFTAEIQDEEMNSKHYNFVSETSDNELPTLAPLEKTTICNDLSLHLEDKLGVQCFGQFLVKLCLFQEIDYVDFLREIKKAQSEQNQYNCQNLLSNLYQTYLIDSSPTYIRLPKEIVEPITTAIKSLQIPNNVFGSCYAYVLQQLNVHWPQYLNSSHYLKWKEGMKSETQNIKPIGTQTNLPSQDVEILPKQANIIPTSNYGSQRASQNTNPDYLDFCYVVSTFKINYPSMLLPQRQKEAENILQTHFYGKKNISVVNRTLVDEVSALISSGSLKIDIFDKILTEVMALLNGAPIQTNRTGVSAQNNTKQAPPQQPTNNPILNSNHISSSETISAPTVPTTNPTPVPTQVSQDSIILRRFNKRGGIRVPIPGSMEQLLSIASEKLKIKAINIREIDTEAEISDLALLKADLVVWVMTAEEEEQFL